jgi:hypothetical protein
MEMPFLKKDSAVRLLRSHVSARLMAGRQGSGRVEARAGIEPAIEVLQTSALPLGYLAESRVASQRRKASGGSGASLACGLGIVNGGNGLVGGRWRASIAAGTCDVLNWRRK